MSSGKLLANSLRRLQAATVDGICRSDQISARDLARLRQAGFLAPICRGWYHIHNPSRPNQLTGWQVHYWAFIRQFLASEEIYHLSADDSIRVQTVPTTLPKRLIVFADRKRSHRTKLPHGLELVICPLGSAARGWVREHEGLQVLGLRCAIEIVSEDCKTTESLSVSAAKQTLASGIAPNTRKFCEEVFARKLELMWSRLRSDLTSFEAMDKLPKGQSARADDLTSVYESEAMNSLWIEGFRPDHQLLRSAQDDQYWLRVRELGRPDRNLAAARGFWVAWQAMQSTLRNNPDPASLISAAKTWQVEMMKPSIAAGLTVRSHSGYRKTPVFIAGSQHIPPPWQLNKPAMAKLASLADCESDPWKRALLSHALFEFIHPFSDGNGRIGRMLMGALLVSSGHKWLVIPYEKRQAYMRALEHASVNCDAAPLNSLARNLSTAEFARSGVDAKA